MNHTRRILTALLLSVSATAARADTEPARLNLGADFRMEASRSMPGAVSQPGIVVAERAYPDHNAMEWQVRVQASADGESPLYENLKSTDFEVSFPTADAPTLHWSKGSHSDATDFQPLEEALAPATTRELESFGGRSSDGAMPYFNLATDGGGLVVAIGWTGDWKASFTTSEGGKVRISAGLKRSRFRLAKGESLRLPSILLMSYRGDWIDGQNRFRRLMLEQFTPANHPPMKLMPVAASVHGMIGFNDTNEANLTALAADIGALKLPLDTYWLDAGWNEGGFPGAQGNPRADPIRHPGGLAPVGVAARAAGMRFLAWFEPERAMRGTWLEREHADWLLSPAGTPEETRYMENDGFRLLDLGNPAARRWATDTVSKEIADAGIEIYRQDFNLYPSWFWHNGEAEDAVGLREVRFINGLYDFLDDLVRLHPGLIIDNCASGGRRLDFEMMRKSVALWRSDSCWDSESYPRNAQMMTHGLSLWLPLHGLGSAAADTPALRSGMGACASFAINYRDPSSVAALRSHLANYLPVRHLFAADFFPLTAWSADPAEWLAFQFNDPTKHEGIVQAFCGAGSAGRALTLKLRGLDPAREYTVTDWDNPAESRTLSGADLANGGITHIAESSPRAVVLRFTSR